MLAAVLQVTPADSLRDAPVVVRAQVHANQLVRFILRQRDAHGIEWTSVAAIRADGSGSATVWDPMRLFWDARPSRAGKAFAWPPHLRPLHATLELDSNRRVLAVRRLVRRQVAPGVREFAVHDAPLTGELFVPAHGTNLPGVVVLGGSEGGYPRDIPALLASHGFAAFSVAYFGVPGLPKDLVKVPVETVARAVGYLANRARVDRRRVGVLGVSRGGELAFLSASLFPQIRAAVGIVPSPILEPGLRFGTGPVAEAAWTYSGKPLPFAPFPQLLGFLRSGNVRPISAALIPFAKIRGPVAIIAGSDDTLGFSGPLFSRARPYLHLRSKDVFADYAGAGHLIDMPYTPTANLSAMRTPYGTLHFGGTPQAYAFADRQSWRVILEFLTRSLERQ